MKINLIAVGTRLPIWVKNGFNDYYKRFPRELIIHLVEIPTLKRHKGANIKQIIKQEGECILQSIPKGSYIIALDRCGKQWSTPQLAENLVHWQHASSNVSLIIGGPDGLHEQCLAKSQQRWSLSLLTLPHLLVRIVVIEAIYRAWTVLKGHPYHR